MNISWQGVQAIVEIINLAAVLLLAIYTYVLNRNKATAAAMQDVNFRLAEHNARLDVIESDGKHILTHNDLSPIYEAVNGVGREISELRGKVEGMQHLAESINRHLMERDA